MEWEWHLVFFYQLGCLDEVFNKITNFEDNTLYVEMFPISDNVFKEYKEKLSKYENFYYFRFWEEVLDI